MLQPCDRRHCAAQHRPTPPPAASVCTSAVPDGAQDADFIAHVLLRLCAATPPERVLPPGETIQQIQSGAGESHNVFSFSFFFLFLKTLHPLFQSQCKNREKINSPQEFGHLWR